MPKKCPPGVFCIENITLSFLIIILGLGMYLLIYIKNNNKNKTISSINKHINIVHTIAATVAFITSLIYSLLQVVTNVV